ncbi:MAG: ABC transporter permease [Gammaproteobacteria bacterium]|nr:MAG: ABC transporter permease [Gammaproteobacteria bacterium]
MRAILIVFGKEFRENLRERRTLVSALILGPLLGPLLFAGGLSLRIERGAEEGERPITLAVAHGERAPNLLGFLRQYGVRVESVDYDATAARAAVQAHRQDMVLAVSADFAAHLTGGTPAPILLYADSSDPGASGTLSRVTALLGQYASLLARLRVVARGVDPLVLSPLALQDIDVATPSSRSVLALGTLSYLVLLTMLMGGMYLAIDTTAGERERGSLEPLLTVPVRREALMFGKILATCAYMTLSLVLTVAAFAIMLRFTGLERFGMSVNFGPLVGLFLITSLLRDERVPAAYLAVSVSATLALGALLIGVAGGLYRREALLG